MITLTGEPRSTQHLYRYHCQFGRAAGYMTAEGKAIKEQYQWEARSQWQGAPFSVPLSAEITFFFGTRRKHDIDNFCKLVLDALTGVVWQDDVLIEELRLRKGYDKERPRVELDVRLL